MEIGVWMLVAAALLDGFSVIVGRWSNFVAAFLALGGFLRLLAPSHLGRQAHEWGMHGAASLGRAVGDYDPRWGYLVSTMLVAVLATIITVLYFAKMWHTAFGVVKTVAPVPGKKGGDGGGKSSGGREVITSVWIWAGSIVLSLFWASVPGRGGHFLRWVLGGGADIAGNGTRWLTSLHQVATLPGVLA